MAAALLASMYPPSSPLPWGWSRRRPYDLIPPFPILDPRAAGFAGPRRHPCSPTGGGKAVTKTRRRRVVELLTLPSVEMATSAETARRRRARATTGAEKEQG